MEQQRTARSSGRKIWLGNRYAGKTMEAISPHEKEQESELTIAREDMHSLSEPVKGDITYIC